MADKDKKSDLSEMILGGFIVLVLSAIVGFILGNAAERLCNWIKSHKRLKLLLESLFSLVLVWLIAMIPAALIVILLTSTVLNIVNPDALEGDGAMYFSLWTAGIISFIVALMVVKKEVWKSDEKTIPDNDPLAAKSAVAASNRLAVPRASNGRFTRRKSKPALDDWTI